MKKNEIEYTISPPGKLKLNLIELWRFRELMYFFTWKDIKVKYKQTALGVLWAILKPTLMMLIFLFFFSKQLKLPTGDLHPVLFYLSGLIFWNLFSQGVTGAGNSMIDNAAIIKKIYFPRLIIPASNVVTALFDFLMSFALYLLLVFYYNPSLQIINFIGLSFLSIFLAIVATFGLGTLISSLNIKYRDFRYIIPFMLQLLFFSSPIIYSLSSIDNSSLKILLSINPITPCIEISRSAISGMPMDGSSMLIGISSIVIIFVLGIFNFKRVEYYIADLT